jgi:hypothetical protein
MNDRISFNCFSPVEVVQGVHTKHNECVTKKNSIPKLRRDNTKLSICRDYKETGARRA